MILIVAIAVGALAAFALLRYVRGVEDDAYEDAQLVEVFMVSQDIVQSTSAEVAQGVAIEVREVPVEFRPANAVTDLAQIAGKVAAGDLAANQILVSGMFIDPQVASVSFADLLTENLVAVAMQFDNVRAVGGFLAPGDEVNMLVTGANAEIAAAGEGDVPVSAEEQIALESTPYQNAARYLYQRVKIIAVGSRLPTAPGEAPSDTITNAGAGTIIFAVPSEAAQRMLSVSADQIYLTLVPSDYEAQVFEPIPEEEITGFLPGEDGRLLTPYGPEGFDAFIEGETTADDQTAAGATDGAATGSDGSTSTSTPAEEVSTGAEG